MGAAAFFELLAEIFRNALAAGVDCIGAANGSVESPISSTAKSQNFPFNINSESILSIARGQGIHEFG
jgi:hypothetical protein